MFTVKCESTEGTYYLVNNWQKSKTFFIDKIPTKKSQLFSRAQDAKKEYHHALESNGRLQR